MNQRPDRPRNISFNILIPESIHHEGVGDVKGQVIQRNVRYNLDTLVPFQRRRPQNSPSDAVSSQFLQNRIKNYVSKNIFLVAKRKKNQYTILVMENAAPCVKPS